ncbi:hypothetical protein DB345_02375 [Spartobacteria bacterium LR76]|nr:hypothetical protein DB345_02375 [Spartobacteria bacterium LR76]
MRRIAESFIHAKVSRFYRQGKPVPHAPHLSHPARQRQRKDISQKSNRLRLKKPSDFRDPTSDFASARLKTEPLKTHSLF